MNCPQIFDSSKQKIGDPALKKRETQMVLFYILQQMFKHFSFLLV